MQANHREEVKALKKKIREEESKFQEACKQRESMERQVQSQQMQIDELKIQLKNKDDQKLEAEGQLKGKGAQLAQVVKELE